MMMMMMMMMNGQAWSSASPRGQWRTGENEENWLRNHLWCPNDHLGYGIDDDDDDDDDDETIHWDTGRNALSFKKRKKRLVCCCRPRCRSGGLLCWRLKCHRLYVPVY